MTDEKRSLKVCRHCHTSVELVRRKSAEPADMKYSCPVCGKWMGWSECRETVETRVHCLSDTIEPYRTETYRRLHPEHDCIVASRRELPPLPVEPEVLRAWAWWQARR